MYQIEASRFAGVVSYEHKHRNKNLLFVSDSNAEETSIFLQGLASVIKRLPECNVWVKAHPLLKLAELEAKLPFKFMIPSADFDYSIICNVIVGSGTTASLLPSLDRKPIALFNSKASLSETPIRALSLPLLRSPEDVYDFLEKPSCKDFLSYTNNSLGGHLGLPLLFRALNEIECILQK